MLKIQNVLWTLKLNQYVKNEPAWKALGIYEILRDSISKLTSLKSMTKKWKYKLRIEIKFEIQKY